MCYEKLKSATIALIFPCHQYNAREMWAKYSLQPRPWITTDLDYRPEKNVKIFENISYSLCHGLLHTWSIDLNKKNSSKYLKMFVAFLENLNFNIKFLFDL